jgi:hypothetical protein
VVGVVKFAGIELARLKCLHKRTVAHGRSSEVEFHVDLFVSKSWSGKEKGPDPKIGATSRNIPQLLAGRRREIARRGENVGAPTLKVKL